MPDCQRAHNRAVTAETWSWLFGMWLCKSCLDMLSAAEAQRCPGAALQRGKRAS